MSISSTMLTSITAFRNPNGSEQEWARMTSYRKPSSPAKVIAAEFAYIVTIPFAIIETAISGISALYTRFASTSEEHEKATNWFQSSAFSIAWSIGDAAINLFCNDMIQTEKVARACAASGQIFAVPYSAL